MGDKNPRVIVDEILTTVGSFGGVEQGGGGFSIRPGGKLIRIPPRQDLQVIPAEDRDELIVETIRTMAQDISNEELREQVLRGAGTAPQ